MDAKSPFVLESGTSRLRLQTIVRLRWIAVLGQTVTVLGVYFGLGFDMPIGFCMLVISLSAWLNIFLRIRYPASHRLRSSHAAAMLAYDTAQLAILLFLTGGLQNPFAFLLVVPVTVAASTQPPRIILGLGALALLCAAALAAVHLPLPWVPGARLSLPPAYTAGALVAVFSGIVFLALYAWRIAKEARQMSNALTATEMVLAREQKLSALDGLAAAAAHGLGTPLATIAVVAKELLRELPQDSPYMDDVVLLQTQARRCRDILSTLSQHEEEDLMFSRMPLSHLVEQVVEPHRAFGIEIEVDAGPLEGAPAQAAREPVFARNPGVLYGLGNLVENAVDFAASRVTVEARWGPDMVALTIRDDGPGIPPLVLEHLGEPYLTTRGISGEAETGSGEGDDAGLGLGYFIAKTLLERSGARLEIRNRLTPEAGAEVQVTWPRRAIDLGPGDLHPAQKQAP